MFNQYDMSVIGMSCSGVVILLSIIFCCYICCRKSSRTTKREITKHLAKQTKARAKIKDKDMVIDEELVDDLYLPIRELIEMTGNRCSDDMNEIQIDPNRVTMGKAVGEGTFSIEYEGILKDKYGSYHSDILIKCLSDEAIHEKDRQDIVDAELRIRHLSHPNILSAIGIITDGNKQKIIVPKMGYGRLKPFLMDVSRILTAGDLASFALQIAYGMEYLSTNGFIHRNLSTRNCMVDESLTVKVSDFELSRPLFDAQYCIKKSDVALPIRWLAIECLVSHKFSIKSDVWAFGVLLWELFTRGMTPYPGLDNSESVSYVKSGKHMEKPPHAPKVIFSLMEGCWATEPSDRPSFEAIARFLHKYKNGRYNGSEENVVFDDLSSP